MNLHIKFEVCSFSHSRDIWGVQKFKSRACATGHTLFPLNVARLNCIQLCTLSMHGNRRCRKVICGQRSAGAIYMRIIWREMCAQTMLLSQWCEISSIHDEQDWAEDWALRNPADELDRWLSMHATADVLWTTVQIWPEKLVHDSSIRRHKILWLTFDSIKGSRQTATSPSASLDPWQGSNCHGSKGA